MSISIFFNHLNLQIIEIDAFHEIVLGETRLAVPPELGYGLVQPDRPGEVELIAHLVQRPEDLVGAGVRAAIGDAGIPQHMIVLKNFCP